MRKKDIKEKIIGAGIIIICFIVGYSILTAPVSIIGFQAAGNSTTCCAPVQMNWLLVVIVFFVSLILAICLRGYKK